MPRKGAINPRTGKRIEWEQEQLRLKEDRNQAILTGAAEATRKEIAILRRQEMAAKSRDKLLTFTRFTMPDPEDPSDVTRSKYEAAAFHEQVAETIEKFLKGELRHEDGRICTQLIFCMPPRHGKTELATKRACAWYSGRHPDHDVIVASASDLLAQDMGADVRTIMNTPQFRQVFPRHKLMRGGSAKDNLQTVNGGRLIFAGRGGTINGRGAHCFPSGTQVETGRGSVAIEQLTVTDEVLSYDPGTGRLVWSAVEAVARRPRARLFRITSAAGRVVEATGDHRFYTARGWVEAAALTAGDRLLCSVRGVGAQEGVRGPEARAERLDRVLLQQSVLGAGGKPEEARSTGLRSVRKSRAPQEELRGPRAGPGLLLGGMPGRRAHGGNRTEGARADEAVRPMQCDVRAVELGQSILRAGLRGPSTFGEDAGREQSTLAGWDVQAALSPTHREALPRDETAGAGEGRALVCSVPGEGPYRGTSHQRGPAGQSGGEPRGVVPTLSREGAFFFGEGDVVRAVEDTRRDAVVYDIQVAETACFFANGILAHNCLLIDDLYKDFEEARSEAVRDSAWNWLTKVALMRRMGKRLTIITMTRWHSDDVIGRLTDPENPHYNAEEAASWMIIRLPGIAEENDPLGRAPGEALWPERYDEAYHRANQRRDPLGFAALVQQTPTVADGVLFRRENIQFYGPGTALERPPEDMRYYCASDHAVGLKQRNDPSCMIKIGVDRQSNIYVLDVIWKRMPTDEAVEAMLTMGTGDAAPLFWWAERGHITGSIGPFLRKRMEETERYINLIEVTPKADKEQRAQSIAARVAMGKVYLPKGAWWTERAVNEMMAFPNGVHDDFVDTLAYLGLGLQSQFSPGVAKTAVRPRTPTGSLAWLRQQNKLDAERTAYRRY